MHDKIPKERGYLRQLFQFSVDQIAWRLPSKQWQKRGMFMSDHWSTLWSSDRKEEFLCQISCQLFSKQSLKRVMFMSDLLSTLFKALTETRNVYVISFVDSLPSSDRNEECLCQISCPFSLKQWQKWGMFVLRGNLCQMSCRLFKAVTETRIVCARSLIESLQNSDRNEQFQCFWKLWNFFSVLFPW